MRMRRRLRLPIRVLSPVSRTGSTAAALTVNYTVGGTATAGADYTALSGNVVIPAGSASATITVTPVDDTVSEGDETVVVTLSSSASYNVGSPSAATVTIADDDAAPTYRDDPVTEQRNGRGAGIYLDSKRQQLCFRFGGAVERGRTDNDLCGRHATYCSDSRQRHCRSGYGAGESSEPRRGHFQRADLHNHIARFHLDR